MGTFIKRAIEMIDVYKVPDFLSNVYSSSFARIGSFGEPVADGKTGIYFASLKVDKMREKADWLWNYRCKKQIMDHPASLDTSGFLNKRKG